MLVAVEARRFARDTRGMGRYVRALLPRLISARPSLSVELYVMDDAQATVAREWHAGSGIPSSRLTVRRIGDLRRSAADIFWYPWNHADPLPPRGPIVITIHDVAPLALPDPRISALFRNLLWRRRYARAASNATIVLTDSEFSAGEVERLLGVARARIRVAHLGPDTPPADARGDQCTDGRASADAAALTRMGVSTPYILTVGSDDRRKDLATAARAVARIVAGGRRVSLVQAGNRRKRNAAPQHAWIVPLGYVEQTDLAVLYRNAAAVAIPSIYEGFGLPLLEAMGHGAPVVCSRAASLPEIGGAAPLWFEPGDDAGMAAALTRLLDDPTVSAACRAAGLDRASRFSWEATATGTLAAFDYAAALAGDR